MKTTRLFRPINFTLAALLLALACVILLTGCGSAANGEGSKHEDSASQGCCH